MAENENDLVRKFAWTQVGVEIIDFNIVIWLDLPVFIDELQQVLV